MRISPHKINIAKLKSSLLLVDFSGQEIATGLSQTQAIKEIEDVNRDAMSFL